MEMARGGGHPCMDMSKQETIRVAVVIFFFLNKVIILVEKAASAAHWGM